jgi:glycosyltransferase involved in cell wall biosynthesis
LTSLCTKRPQMASMVVSQRQSREEAQQAQSVRHYQESRSLKESSYRTTSWSTEADTTIETGKVVDTSQLTPYPVALPLDVSRSLVSPQTLDKAGVPSVATADTASSAYHPTAIAQYALAAWNAYLDSGNARHRQTFMAQVAWLREHEVRLTTGAGVWPISSSARPGRTPKPVLSALTQGNVVSVLTRAYRLTGEETLLPAAHRAVQPVLQDILDGGVLAPVGDDGIFFEETAVYPAAHVLSGHLFVILGLHDYLSLTDDAEIADIMGRGHTTLHRFLEEFDARFWSRSDLLHRHLASPATHTLHAALLGALAQALPCEQCASAARRWATQQFRPSSRLRYSFSKGAARVRSAAGNAIRRVVFGRQGTGGDGGRDLVCVPITAFPVPGGMRSVLAGVASAMTDEWEIEYLTRIVGAHSEDMTIHAFGNARANPWRFPNIWLYTFAGARKLTRLLRHGRKYSLIIPQDGAFTGAFAAVVARLAGVRVLCMDHGNVTLPYSPVYRAEWKNRRMAVPWPRRLLSILRDACYFPSLRWMVRLATRYSDAFLPAGVDVADAYIHRYGVQPSRIMHYPFMIDIERMRPLEDVTRSNLHAQQGLARDAIIITMVNRLAPEKGINAAIAALSQALLALPADVRARVRLIIAGEGALRPQIEADIRSHGLESVCRLWGEATRDEVAMLLGISDIFLHTGTRGINPVALLEAMAAGCGVISTTAPQVVAQYLDEGRGIAVPIGDVDAIAGALTRTMTDLPLSRDMGRLAREYIAVRHTATALKRSLLRATYWTPNIAALQDGVAGTADAPSEQQSANTFGSGKQPER